jgi:protein ImuB
VLWCLRQRDLFAPSLAQVGLPPERVIFAEAGDEAGSWPRWRKACAGLAWPAWSARSASLSMTASRRLQLAAEKSGQMAMAIRRWKRVADAADLGQPTAATTRWRVSALPSSPLPVPGVGRPRWFLELLRCRAGDAFDIELEACDAKGHLRLPAPLAHRPVGRAQGRKPARARAAPPPETRRSSWSGGRPPPRDRPPEPGRRPGRPAHRPGRRPRHRPGPGPGAARPRPEGDQAALQRLALWAQRLYSPTVAADPPDGLVIDATGCAHLFGGEEKMLIDLRGAGQGRPVVPGRHRRQLGRRPRPGPVQRRDRSSSPRRARPAASCKDLPVAALRLPADLVQTLSKLGFDTIGELEATAKGPVGAPPGPGPVRRLDQAFGREAEPIEPVLAPETLRVSKVFAEPIGAPETLARYVTQLTGRALRGAGGGRPRAPRRLDAWFFRVDNRIETARIGMAAPSRDAKRLAKLLCEKLETVDPGFGVDKMLLAAPGAEPLAYKQDEAAMAKAKASRRPVGPDRHPVQSPGRRARLSPGQRRQRPARAQVRKAPALERPQAFSWPADWPRPTRFFPRPEPIETVALLPDAAAGLVHLARGAPARARADGPERVFGEWWKADAELARSRDYFQVEDEGGERFWIFRDGDGEDATGSQRWFMAGVFG